MFFSQTNSLKNDIVIYKSLLEIFERNSDEKIESFFTDVISQSKRLLNNEISFFEVDTKAYNLVEYLIDECNEDVKSFDSTNSLSPLNYKILLRCLKKNELVA